MSNDGTANPAPLGLFGFGMTTVLLNIHNLGVFEINAMILAMGIFYGGLAQIIAGVLEWRKNNTFGTTAFTSYGLFWLTLVGIFVLPKLNPDWKMDATSMACYLGMWGFFTLLLFIGTLRLSKALQFVFGSLVVLFALLAAAKGAGSEGLMKVAGVVGIICGGSAIYTGAAQVLNEVWGRTILPLGPRPA
jgi:succinate-acetate transporter protein